MKKGAILLISMIILLIIFILKITIEPSSEEPIITEPEPAITGHAVYEETEIPEQETTPIFEDVGEPPALPELPQPLPEQPTPNFIYEAHCINNRIEVVLTNPTDETLDLVEDIIVHLNGMIVVDPKCSRYTIMPGKRVLCSDISGHLAIREGRKNNIQISMSSEKFNSIIDCAVQ